MYKQINLYAYGPFEAVGMTVYNIISFHAYIYILHSYIAIYIG